MVSELTERRQLILKLVVQEFIARATPVASEALVRTYDLPISSATVRNELSVLEELGYLTHFHTSAGRVPTDSGYRFFVENLMESIPLSVEEQEKIHQQFFEIPGDLEQWLQLAAAVLAQKAQTASVVTPPRPYQAIFKRLEAISVNENIVLLVLVLNGGTVKQKVITLEESYTQTHLRQISAHISDRCIESNTNQIHDFLTQCRNQLEPEFEPFEQYILNEVLLIMKQSEDESNGQIHSDGLLEMLSQPEFISELMKEEDANRIVEHMRRTLELFTSSNVLSTVLVQTLSTNDVQVIIGGEHNNEAMQQYSVVLSRYGVDGKLAGVLGVIGPKRMWYPRTISTVRYISLIMSNVLNTFYGNALQSPYYEDRRNNV